MMTRLKRTIGACVLASTLLPTIATHAATYYVATNGNNSNPGTSSQPWRTIAYAVSKMGAGDTTYVQGGTYKEEEIRFVRSGTQSAPIKLLNQSGQFPVIDCIDKNKFHRVLFKSSSGYQYPIGWITVEGFEIRNCYEGIKIYNGHDITIQRNWIHHAAKQGIAGNGTRILINRNRIDHNGRFGECATKSSVCGLDHGIYSNGTGYTITNNLIYDNLAYGIQVNGTVRYNSAVHAGPEFALTRNWVIANNTFAYQNYGSGIVLWGSECDNARIENNTFYENAVKWPSYAPQGINFVSMGSTGITIRNNLVFASGAGGMQFLSRSATPGVHYTQSGNIVNTVKPNLTNQLAAPISLRVVN